MSPLQFLARLAALIPPPRHPLIRFYGVFAPHSSWREKVVPIRLPCCHQRDEDGSCSPDSTAAAAATTATTVARIVKSSTLPILAHRCSDPAPYCTAAIVPRYVAPAAVHEPSTRIDWAELLKRVYDVDALACPCGGRLKFAARAILESLRLPAERWAAAGACATRVCHSGRGRQGRAAGAGPPGRNGPPESAALGPPSQPAGRFTPHGTKCVYVLGKRDLKGQPRLDFGNPVAAFAGVDLSAQQGGAARKAAI